MEFTNENQAAKFKSRENSKHHIGSVSMIENFKIHHLTTTNVYCVFYISSEGVMQALYFSNVALHIILFVKMCTCMHHRLVSGRCNSFSWSTPKECSPYPISDDLSSEK